MVTPSSRCMKVPDLPPGIGSFRFLYFSELMKRPVCAGKIQDRLGKVDRPGLRPQGALPRGRRASTSSTAGASPPSSSPGTGCCAIEDDAIFVQPPEQGERYPPFVDQPGWILLDNHLMGRTILDMDGRRIEVVNDVHLLEAKGRLLLIHVDTSFNGFLRRWGSGGSTGSRRT